MKALVIGGTGFCAAPLCQKLLAQGHKLRILARGGAEGLSPHRRALLEGAEIVKGDFADPDGLRAALEGVEMVIHAATAAKMRDSALQSGVRADLLPSLALMEAMIEAGISRLVYFSSAGAVYGEGSGAPFAEGAPRAPLSAYGLVKNAVENALAIHEKAGALTPLILRLSNPYGPGQTGEGGQGVAAVFLRRAMAGEAIRIFGDGAARKDYIYIDDAAEAMARLVTRGARGAYNIASGRSYSINDIAQAVERATGCALQRDYIRADAASSGVDVLLDNAKLRRDADWRAQTALEEGLARHYAWLRGDGAIGPPSRAAPWGH